MSGSYHEADQTLTCPFFAECGGCQYMGVPYRETLALKQREIDQLFADLCVCAPIVGMYRPVFYRNKVHGIVGVDSDKKIITGTYQEGTHRLVPVDSCMIEDAESDRIMAVLCSLFTSFRYEPFNEDTGRGFMRHVLIRRGFSTKEIMVVLVTAEVAFPSKNNFLKALLAQEPNITTVIQNINPGSTSMVLGKRSRTIYGKGFIEDVLCGCRFRISPDSFYQINPAQTEKLYKAAIQAAGIGRKDTVIDAYCGIGTIGITAAAKAGQVIGVELNARAVEDAKANAALNGVKNIRFVNGDAGAFLVEYARRGKADVVFLDPPRSGATPDFLNALMKIRPDRVVYISCNPQTQVRDLKVLIKGGYKVAQCRAFDLFPWTGHVETVVLMSRVKDK